MPERTRVPVSRSRRALAALPLAALAAMLGGFVGMALTAAGVGSPVHANEMESSTPEEGGETSPDLTEITIRFVDEITGQAEVLLVCGPTANERTTVVTGGSAIADDGHTITTPISGELTDGGSCVATWILTDAGGETDRGTLSFSVRSGAATAPADAGEAETDAVDNGEAAPPADDDGDENGVVASSVRSASTVSSGPIWLGRILSTIGVAVLFGSIVLIVAAWPEGPEYVLALRFLRTVWVIGLIGTLMYVAGLAAAVKGESFGSGLNPGAWFDLFDAGWAGRAAVIRVVLVVACGWVVMRPERAIDPTTNMLAVALPALAVITLGLSRPGGSLAFLGVIASVAHVLAISVWLGAVVLLARVVLAGPGEEDLVHAVYGFTRLANPALVITVVSGLIQLYRQVGGELFTTGHGRVLLLKTVAVAAAIFVGMTASQVARARLARASELSVRVAERLRRAFGTQAAIGVVILMLTGWMLTLTPGKVSETDDGTRFAVREPIVDPASGLDIEVRLSPGRVGENDLQVVVRSPTSGLEDLTVTFTPPEGGEMVVAQEICSSDEAPRGGLQCSELDGGGMAQTASGSGLPFDVAGTWTLAVSATTPDGSAQDVARQFEILTADGSLVSNSPSPIPATPTTIATGPTLPTDDGDEEDDDEDADADEDDADE